MFCSERCGIPCNLSKHIFFTGTVLYRISIAFKRSLKLFRFWIVLHTNSRTNFYIYLFHYFL